MDSHVGAISYGTRDDSDAVSGPRDPPKLIKPTLNVAVSIVLSPHATVLLCIARSLIHKA